MTGGTVEDRCEQGYDIQQHQHNDSCDRKDLFGSHFCFLVFCIFILRHYFPFHYLRTNKEESFVGPCAIRDLPKSRNCRQRVLRWASES